MSQMVPLLVTDFVLTPPGDQTAEDWLAQFDQRPHVIPTWPLSSQMALVVVVSRGFGSPPDDSESVASVVTRKEDVDRFFDGVTSVRKRMALFFTVPKERVIPFCSGLSLDSWPAE